MRAGLALAVAVAVIATPALVARPARVAHVREQRDLTGPLDGGRDLVLVPAAGAGDAPRADLAAVADELAERRDVLVVDVLDLVAAVLVRLPATGARAALLVTPACRPAALLCHLEDLSCAACHEAPLGRTNPRARRRRGWSIVADAS